MSTNRIILNNAPPKDNLSAVVDPSTSNDSTEGYAVGSTWTNVVTKEAFTCTSVSVGAANWVSTTAFAPTVLAADPATPALGQVWFNSTTNTLKTHTLVGTPVWAYTAPLPSPTSAAAGVGPSVNDALVIAGYNGGWLTATRNFNGSAWSTNTPTLVGRSDLRAVGSTSAAMTIDGNVGSPYATTSDVTLFDGSVWTNGVSALTVRYNVCAVGSQTDALLSTGINTGVLSTSEKFNGTIWATATNSPLARHAAASSGTPTAMLVTGGRASNAYAQVYEYNGSTWVGMATISSARYRLRGTGTSTDTTIFGGVNGSTYTGLTEHFNGTAWTTMSAMLVIKIDMAASGASTSALSPGGANSGGVVSTSESYSKPAATATFTVV